MAVAFRAASSASIAATRSPAVDKPTGTVDGDVVLAWFLTDTVMGVIAVPSGWTQVGTQQADPNNDGEMIVLRHVAASDGASYTFTNLFGANEDGVCGAISYSGVDNTTPINAVTQNGFGNQASPVPGVSVDPTVEDAMIVCLAGADASAAFSATPDLSPAATERLDAQGTNSAWIYAQEFLNTGTHAAVALDINTSGTENVIVFSVALTPTGATPEATSSHYITMMGCS